MIESQDNTEAHKITVLDSCVVNDMISENQYNFQKYVIMNFQTKQIRKSNLRVFLSSGGRVLEKIEGESLRKKDQNYFLLDRRTYSIKSYDKQLKRRLKKEGYLVI